MFQINKLYQFTGHQAAIYALSSADAPGKFLSAAGDGLVACWDVAKPDEAVALSRIEGNIFSMMYDPDINRLVLGNMYGGLHWIDLNQKLDYYNVLHHQKGVYFVQKYADYLYSGGADGVITRWHYNSNKPELSVQLSHSSLRCMVIDTEGQKMAVGASDGNIYILRLEDLSIVQTLESVHSNSVFSLAFEPDGQSIWSGGRDAQLCLTQLDSAETLFKAPAHWYTINALAISPDQHLLISASRDKSIKIWDRAERKLLKVIDMSKTQAHFGSVNCLLFLDNHHFVSAGDDRQAIVWRFEL
jgi:WD repeat-containing protein 61